MNWQTWTAGWMTDLLSIWTAANMLDWSTRPIRSAQSPQGWQWSCWSDWACSAGRQEVASCAGVSPSFSVPQCCHHNLHIHTQQFLTQIFFLPWQADVLQLVKTSRTGMKDSEFERTNPGDEIYWSHIKWNVYKNGRKERQFVHTAPQSAVVDLYGGETVTAQVELSLHLEADWVPLQDRPLTAAGVSLLTGKERDVWLTRNM